MSAPPQLRRKDKEMSEARAHEVLAPASAGDCDHWGGRLALLRAPSLCVG